MCLLHHPKCISNGSALMNDTNIAKGTKDPGIVCFRRINNSKNQATSLYNTQTILTSRCGEYILTMLVLQLGHELNTKSVNYKFWKVINLPIYESSTHRVLVKTKYEKSPIYSIIFSSCFFIIILKREIEWWPNVRNTRLAMEGAPVPPRVSPLHPFLRSLPSRKVSPPVASPTIDCFHLI